MFYDRGFPAKEDTDRAFHAVGETGCTCLQVLGTVPFLATSYFKERWVAPPSKLSRSCLDCYSISVVPSLRSASSSCIPCSGNIRSGLPCQKQPVPALEELPIRVVSASSFAPRGCFASGERDLLWGFCRASNSIVSNHMHRSNTGI